jgi:hypothetical protein
MASCIAITKKGTQCRNGKAKDIVIDINQPVLFCTLHYKKNPDSVILEGINKIIPYIDVEHYLADLLKFNQPQNQIIQPQLEQSIPSKENERYTTPKTLVDIPPICTVCSDEFPNRNNLIICSSSGWEFNHLVCSGCLKGHVSSLLSDGIASLECMFNKHEHCHGQYSEEDIKHILDIDTASADVIPAASAETTNISSINYSKWQEIMTASEIIKLAGICDNYLICPLCCKWGCIFEIPVGAEKHPFYIKCAACQKEWCTLCKRNAHSSRSCYQLEFSETEIANVEGMVRVIDKMIQDIATRALTHSCSICGCNYVKEEGCNLMTCPKCNGMSCFICGMKLYYKGDTKYWHFTGHDKADRDAKCPLWNNHAGDGQEKQGNTYFNLSSIGKEFQNFLNSNKTNQQLFKLICQRIIANYEKDKAFNNMLKNIRIMAY